MPDHLGRPQTDWLSRLRDILFCLATFILAGCWQEEGLQIPELNREHIENLEGIVPVKDLINERDFQYICLLQPYVDPSTDDLTLDHLPGLDGRGLKPWLVDDNENRIILMAANKVASNTYSRAGLWHARFDSFAHSDWLSQFSGYRRAACGTTIEAALFVAKIGSLTRIALLVPDNLTVQKDRQ